MAIRREELAVMIALRAAEKDPGAGRVRVKRGQYAEVYDTAAGRVLVVQRGDRRVVLTRSPAAPDPAADYPSQLPFIPNATVWWTPTGRSAATWVDSSSPEQLAATLTAHFIAEGWSAESALLTPRAKVTVLKHGGLKRTITWDRHRVLFFDSPVWS